MQSFTYLFVLEAIMSEHKVNKHNLANLDNPERENYLPSEFVKTLLEPYQGKSIIDYGCGTGYFTQLYSSIALNEKVYAVDVLPEAVAITKERTKSLANVEVFLSEEKMSPLADSVGDVAISIFTLHEFDDRKSIILEFKRMLKPSGALVIIDWAPESPASKGPPLHKRISKKEAIESFEAQGFSLIQDNQGIEPYLYTLIFKNNK